jgi:hypothetical protein
MKVNCSGCSKPFSAKPSRISRSASVYCTASCRLKHGWKGGRDQSKYVERNCKTCGKMFAVLIVEDERNSVSYCSRALQAGADSENGLPTLWRQVPALAKVYLLLSRL